MAISVAVFGYAGYFSSLVAAKCMLFDGFQQITPLYSFFCNYYVVNELFIQYWGVQHQMLNEPENVGEKMFGVNEYYKKLNF